MSVLDVIKYEGGNDVLVWKHPAEDFNTSSTLIVHESQEAIFFKNGQIADCFGAGRYVLKTENIPLLRKLINLPTGGVSTFHCEVYFVNKVERMALKWGTDSKVQFIEPTYNFPMEIGASGDMAVKIIDAAPFLVRLVGMETMLTPEGLLTYFRGILMNRVKSYLARTIKEQQLNIFEIDSQLDVLSEAIHAKLREDFREYGLDLTVFVIRTVVRPEDDRGYCQLKEAMASRYTDVFQAQTDQQTAWIRKQTEAQSKVIMAQAEAQKRQLEGYTYQEERAFDVAERAVSNESAGNFTNMGIGLGMMAGIGGAVGGANRGMEGGAMSGFQAAGPAAAPVPPQAQAPQMQAAQPQTQAGARICPHCSTSLPAAARFCFACGAQLPPVCKVCGKELPEGARFCLYCGQPQD